ncbi:MAG: nucleoside deaminase [Acidimicrobiales bacterium]
MGGVRIDAPAWLDDEARPSLGVAARDEERMAWVCRLLERQVAERTGGPFSAAVFDGWTGEVLSAAVNRVEPASACIAHAETLALAEAGQVVGSFTLDGRAAVLVTSAEPCAMCLGAIGWSGVDRVVCGATDPDARAIGFDEGDKPADWQASLESRGISVATGVLREQITAAMERYVAQGGTVYNGEPEA